MGYLVRGVDAADQRVQDVHVVVTMQQDEGQQGLQQSRLRHGPDEELQVGGSGHHLLQGQLERERERERERASESESESERERDRVSQYTTHTVHS